MLTPTGRRTLFGFLASCCLVGGIIGWLAGGEVDTEV